MTPVSDQLEDHIIPVNPAEQRSSYHKDAWLKYMERKIQRFTRVISRVTHNINVRTRYNLKRVIIAFSVVLVILFLLCGGFSFLAEVISVFGQRLWLLVSTICFYVKFLFIQAEIDDEQMLLLYG